MTYPEALAYIAALEPRGWRLGLDRMEEFVRRAGLDDAIGPASPSFIHVAGTNGKGSVTAYVQSILTAAGHRAGAFFSPYVVDPRERVQLNGKLIPEADLARITDELIPIEQQFVETDFGGITEFEFKTAIGFKYWKEQAAEWVALEVGLGGRLDATNVVTPKATVIVSIGHDHMSILGHSLAEIAGEKAGIIKPGIPVIVGELDGESMAVVQQKAEAARAPIWKFGREIRIEGQTLTTPANTYHGLTPVLYGAKQPHNMALAIAAIEAAGITVSEEKVREGIAEISLPGRFQRMERQGRTIILDGAHNPESAQALRASLVNFLSGKAKPVLVTNMLQGHEPDAFFSELVDLVDTVHVVPIEFRRARTVDETVDLLKGMFPDVTGHETPMAGIDGALADAGEHGHVLVTGSFYLVGEMLRMLT